MKKVLFTVGNFGTGGKERQLSYLIKYLPKETFECHLLMKINSGYYFNDIENDLKSFYSFEKKSFEFKDILTIIKYINKINPDVIFSFSNITSYFLLLIKKILFKKYILIDGSIRDANDLLSFQIKIRNYLHNFFNFVVSNSTAGLKSRSQFGKKGRFVLYNGFDLNNLPLESKDELRKKLNLPPEKKIIIMVSSLRKCFSKRPEEFIDLAYLAKCKNLDNFYFLLVGDGELFNDLKRKSESLQLNNYLHLLGNKTNILEYLKASDISVLISKNEGISNAILESMAIGIPVITTSRGGSNEIVNDGQNGFIVNNINEMYEKIKLLIDNQELYNSISIRSSLKISEFFSINTMIKSFQNLIIQTSKS